MSNYPWADFFLWELRWYILGLVAIGVRAGCGCSGVVGYWWGVGG
jgi:hypothetical protein